MDEHPDAGGLGVKMIDGKGQFLPESKRGLPTPWVAFYKIFGLSSLFKKSKIFGKYHLSYLSDDEIHEIEVLAGAFMLMRKKTLDKVGLLDEDYFMYGEDIDLSWLPGAELWPVKIDPSQIDQILANLCVNARDAIKEVGQVTIETKNINFDIEYCADHAGFIPGDYVMLLLAIAAAACRQKPSIKFLNRFSPQRNFSMAQDWGSPQFMELSNKTTDSLMYTANWKTVRRLKAIYPVMPVRLLKWVAKASVRPP